MGPWVTSGSPSLPCLPCPASPQGVSCRSKSHAECQVASSHMASNSHGLHVAWGHHEVCQGAPRRMGSKSPLILPDSSHWPALCHDTTRCVWPLQVTWGVSGGCQSHGVCVRWLQGTWPPTHMACVLRMGSPQGVPGHSTLLWPAGPQLPAEQAYQ